MHSTKRKCLSRQGPSCDAWEDGSLIWANFSRKLWSGVVLAGSENDNNLPEGKYRVFWFGDYTTSEITYTTMVSFKDNYKEVVKLELKRSSKTWQRGVAKTLQVLYQTSTVFSTEDINRLAVEGLPDSYYVNRVPEWVTKILTDSKKLEAEADETDFKVSCPPAVKELIEKKMELHQPVTEICLGCYAMKIELLEHPLFEGNCCQQCMSRIRDNLYVKGDDGVCYYCTICGFPGEVIICEDSRCGRVYCRVCVTDLAGPYAWEMYLADKNWNCFMCCEVERNGVIFRRSNYLNKIPHLFSSNDRAIVPPPTNLSSRKKLRVLSLFDGIGTGLLVLDLLNVPVEKYYSCETDINAKNITTMHFGSRITQLGDVKNIRDDRIQEISPIHLVLAGSPCNELSLANPKRKGLFDADGTGQLFFDFFRIIGYLKTYNPDGFYWFFENVASMPLVFRDTINRFLHCQPTMVDAAWLSAQCRPRLFWGNVPYMHQPVIVKKTHLQEYLQPKRTALVERIRTVTTRSNSLKQNTELQYPVLDSIGRPDVVWITELEEIFGFPRHFTDTGNLSVSQRQQVLGKAWSVQTVTVLLRFLTEIYTEKPTTNIADMNKPTSSVTDMKKLTNSVADMKKPTNSVADMKKPKNSVADMKKPTNSVANMKKPTNSVADTKKPKNSVSDTKKPKNSVTDTTKPKNSVTDTKKPKNSVTDTKKPKNSVTDTKKPKNSVTDTKKPKNSVTDTKKPKNSVSDMRKPKNRGSDMKKPKNSVSDMKKPKK